MTTLLTKRPETRARIRFDRNELAGAFGDIGTDLPLIIGMTFAAGFDVASVLVMFGVMQLFSGWFYGLPMPAQPLKVVAVLVIAGEATPEMVYGGGLAIGIIMLVFAATGFLNLLAKWIPKCVVRGIQLGLGLKLGWMALGTYIPAGATTGYILAGIAFLITLVLLGNRKYPAALFVIGLGVLYAVIFKLDWGTVGQSVGFTLPTPHVPSWSNIWLGFIVLALPQLPLSLGNSVFATEQTIKDLFPEEHVPLRKIGFTYSLMNLIAPFFSGLPVCHGSGGLAGHHAFGGRTGGSVILYGGLFLVLGLVFAGGFSHIVQVFPLPILGVILLFEAMALMSLVKDTVPVRLDFIMALVVGLTAFIVPYGFVLALVGGSLLYRLLPSKVWCTP